MVHTRPTLPAGHGELVVRPEFAEWAGRLQANREASRSWSFQVAGLDAGALRRQAREQLLGVAEGFSTRLGVPVRPAGAADGPIVATGHQPELYHPGVWVKDFLLERLSVAIGATAVDLVVDTDGFDSIAVTSPCMNPGLERCKQYLAVGSAVSCYAGTAVPSDGDLEAFCRSGDEMLAMLPAPSVRRHFSAFCAALKGAAHDSDNIAELVTIARRRYEATAGTGYLEAPMTAVARTEAFTCFAVDIALSVSRFAEAYNAELDEYRSLSKTRSSAQPFPNLARDGEAIELPFWHIDGGLRATVWAEPLGRGGMRLRSDRGLSVDLPSDPKWATATVREAGLLIAPKALALTLFMRVFACDLFIHGIGGGRYDLVTDGVIRRYFGIEPPAYVVGSMTMYLPLGAHVVGDEEVAAAKERLNRLTHNPDTLLSEVEFDSPVEKQRALSLSAEKTELVAAIGKADADKKALGARIREVNSALASVLEPLRQEFETELSHLEAQRAAADILTDRTYPFCFWDPSEIADKIA